MSDKIINVLYVDDEKNNLNSFRATFKKKFNIFTALSSAEAEVILGSNNIHVLITDQRMPVKLGTELLADAVVKYPDQTRIIMTAFSETVEIKQAIKSELAFRSIEKPWNEEELEDVIKLGYESYLWRVLRQKNLDNFDAKL